MAESRPYVLDTDIISLFQRGEPTVRANLLRVEAANRFVTVVSVAEQLQGWLAVIRRARSEAEAARNFQRLYETLHFYRTLNILTYDAGAVREFNRLHSQKIRIGTQDLRIGAIALSRNAILVTRNTRDFSRIPSLTLADWSQPEA